ncbi:MAG: hypothetical protein R2789_04705 [Microthrixaceae bacterium]
MTARSVVASVLLGTVPPVMSVRALVRAGELFGLAEGTVRTALSRMTAAGELVREDSGRYALAGHLIQRQAHQQLSRQPDFGVWNGSWQMRVVELGSRAPSDRGPAIGCLVAAAGRDARRRLVASDNLRSSIESVSHNTHSWFLAGPPVRHPSRPHDELAAELPGSGALTPTPSSCDGPCTHLQNSPGASRPLCARGSCSPLAVLRQFNADPLLPQPLRGAHQ